MTKEWGMAASWQHRGSMEVPFEQGKQDQRVASGISPEGYAVLGHGPCSHASHAVGDWERCTETPSLSALESTVRNNTDSTRLMLPPAECHD